MAYLMIVLISIILKSMCNLENLSFRDIYIFLFGFFSPVLLQLKWMLMLVLVLALLILTFMHALWCCFDVRDQKVGCLST